MALNYSHGNKLILEGLCIINAPDNDVEQHCLVASRTMRALLVNVGIEAKLWKFERARSLTILLVCPVDKVVQGVWKSFLPLPAILEDIISNYFSDTCKGHKISEKVTKPFEELAFSSPEGEVFPIFSTKAVKKLVSLYFSATSMVEEPLLGQLVYLYR